MSWPLKGLAQFLTHGKCFKMLGRITVYLNSTSFFLFFVFLGVDSRTFHVLGLCYHWAAAAAHNSLSWICSGGFLCLTTAHQNTGVTDDLSFFREILTGKSRFPGLQLPGPCHCSCAGGAWSLSSVFLTADFCSFKQFKFYFHSQWPLECSYWFPYSSLGEFYSFFRRLIIHRMVGVDWRLSLILYFLTNGSSLILTMLLKCVWQASRV